MNLKIAIRSLRKNRLFTALNVAGLAIGMAVAACLFLLVRHERSFDGFYPKKDQIFRVVLNRESEPGKLEPMPNAPNIAGPAAKEGIAAVKNFARILANNFTGAAFVSVGEKSFVAEKLVWADPSLAEIFELKTVSGDLVAALREPNSVALSRSEAVRFFGTSDPVGREIRIDRRDPVQVRAVFEDFGENSTIEAKIIGSFISEKWANNRLVWSNASFETWLLLDGAADRRAVENELTQIYHKATSPAGRWFTLWLQPLADVHFGTAGMKYSISERVGDARQVGLLAALALAILLIACFNYMNLATANAQTRAREVGISKAIGASKSALIGRFYAETAVLVAISMLLAIGLVAVGLPFFNQMADKKLGFSTLFEPSNLAIFGGIGAAVALFAGSYPAFLMSSFLPKNLMRSDFGGQKTGNWLRKSLVTVQFAAAVVLIVGTIGLWRQMQFIQQKSLGFDPEQVVAITTIAAEKAEQIDGLMGECRQLAAVRAVCRSQTMPGMTASGRQISRSETDENGLPLQTCRATEGIENVLGIRILAGRGLQKKAAGDTLVQVVLTQKGVDYLGFSPEQILGKRVECSLGPNAIVVGVAENFHSKSLHEPLGAYAFHDAETENRPLMLVKMQTADLLSAMAQLEKTYKKHFPAAPFEARFLDSQIEKMYRADRRTAKVMSVFGGLAVFVACLGLFGLAAFAAAKRTKEIGIRKVLGASIASINLLLVRDFLKLVAAAFCLGTPVAHFLMKKWLAGFAYRIEIEWWFFAVAGLAAIVVAFLTVSFQAIKAALADPVKSLRSE